LMEDVFHTRAHTFDASSSAHACCCARSSESTACAAWMRVVMEAVSAPMLRDCDTRRARDGARTRLWCIQAGQARTALLERDVGARTARGPGAMREPKAVSREARGRHAWVPLRSTNPNQHARAASRT
jgi:hypothetical protein